MAILTNDLQAKKAAKVKKTKKKKGSKAKITGGFKSFETCEPIPMSEAVSAEEYAKRIEPLVQPKVSASFEDKLVRRAHLPVEVQHPDTARISTSKNTLRKKQLRNAIRYMTPRDSRKLLGLNAKRHKKIKTTAGH
jgi:hypothetical protein